jgi:hypothetical protein
MHFARREGFSAIPQITFAGGKSLPASGKRHSTHKKAKPADAYGVQYAWQVGDPVPATPTDLPKSKFSRKVSEKFLWDPGDQGKPVYYATAYENSKGDVGPWSAIVSTIIP